jgi:hypothetical protein
VAQNAFKHGLSVSAESLSQYSSEIDNYLHQLIDDQTPEAAKEEALIIAYAQVDIDRARRIRLSLYNNPTARVKKPTQREADRIFNAQVRFVDSLYFYNEETGQAHFFIKMPEKIEEGEVLFSLDKKDVSLEEGVGVLAPTLSKLWRYESRALTRRDKAIKRFRAARETKSEASRGSDQSTSDPRLAGSQRV